MNSIDPARPRDLEAAVRHHRAGRLREAVAAYENLLRVTPDDADVMQLLGVALGQLGNHEAAVRFLERSSQLKPDRPTVLLKRSDLLRRMAGLTLILGLHWGQWDVVQTRWSATANDRPRPNRAPCTPRPS